MITVILTLSQPIQFSLFPIATISVEQADPIAQDIPGPLSRNYEKSYLHFMKPCTPNKPINTTL